MQADPLGIDGGSNVYMMANLNPLWFIDPYGLCPWYDEVASYMDGQVQAAKDIVNSSGMHWLLAGTVNTVMDLGLGLASYPSSLMHMGEAAGRYSVDPSLENLAGVYSDIALGAGTAAAMLAYVPSANVPLGAPRTSNGTANAAQYQRLKDAYRSQELLDMAHAGKGGPIAGAGTSKLIRDISRITSQYGGTQSDWAKMATSTRTLSATSSGSPGGKISVHYYKNIRTGKVVEFKTKLPENF